MSTEDETGPREVAVSTVGTGPLPRPFEPIRSPSVQAEGEGFVVMHVPLPRWQDINGNGVPDWQEPWLYRLIWGVVSFFAGRNPDSRVGHAVRLVDELVDHLEAKQP